MGRGGAERALAAAGPPCTFASMYTRGCRYGPKSLYPPCSALAPFPQRTQVVPSTKCDTHAAIKCKCDGSRAAAALKLAANQQRAARAQQAHKEGGGGKGGAAEGATEEGAAEEGEGEEAGVLDWAHLADPTASPDPTWGDVSGGPWLGAAWGGGWKDVGGSLGCK